MADPPLGHAARQTRDRRARRALQHLRRGHTARRLSKDGGSSSDLQPTQGNGSAAQLGLKGAGVLADKKKVHGRDKRADDHAALWEKTRLQGEAAIEGAKAYAARAWTEFSEASKGRNRRRSLAPPIDFSFVKDPKEENYGRFIDRIRKERCKTLIEIEAERDARAAAAIKRAAELERRSSTPPPQWHERPPSPTPCMAGGPRPSHWSSLNNIGMAR